MVIPPQTEARILAVLQDRRVRHREVLRPDAIGVRVDVIDVDPPAMIAAHSHEYDLLLLDTDHDLSAAIQWCQKLKERFSAPLLVLTPGENEQGIIALYAAGADECIVRPAAADILWAKLRAWLRWSPPFTNRHGSAVQTANPVTALKGVTVQVVEVEPAA